MNNDQIPEALDTDEIGKSLDDLLVKLHTVDQKLKDTTKKNKTSKVEASTVGAGLGSSGPGNLQGFAAGLGYDPEKKTRKKNLKEHSKKKINLGAGFLFRYGDKVLLLKRSDWCSNGNKWGNPGGHVERNDFIPGKPYQTFVQAAMREAHEEIGSCPPHKISKHIIRQKPDKMYVLFIADVKEEFTPTLNNEHSDYMWVPINNMQEMDLHPALQEGGSLSGIPVSSIGPNNDPRSFSWGGPGQHSNGRTKESTPIFKFYDKDGKGSFSRRVRTLRRSPSIPRDVKQKNFRFSTQDPTAIIGRGLFQVDHLLRELISEEGPYNIGNPSAPNYFHQLMEPADLEFYDHEGKETDEPELSTIKVIANSPEGSSIHPKVEGNKMRKKIKLRDMFESWEPGQEEREEREKASLKALKNVANPDKNDPIDPPDGDTPGDAPVFGQDFRSISTAGGKESIFASISSLFNIDNEANSAKELAKRQPLSKNNSPDRNMLRLSEWYIFNEDDNAADDDEDDEKENPSADANPLEKSKLAKPSKPGAIDINVDGNPKKDDNLSVSLKTMMSDKPGAAKVSDMPSQGEEDAEGAPVEAGPEKGPPRDRGDTDSTQKKLNTLDKKLSTFLSSQLSTKDPVRVYETGGNIVIEFNRKSGKESGQVVQLIINNPNAIGLNIGRRREDGGDAGMSVMNITL